MSNRRSKLAARLRETEEQAELSQHSLGEEVAVARREREVAAEAAAAEAQRRELAEKELVRLRRTIADEVERRRVAETELAAARYHGVLEY